MVIGRSKTTGEEITFGFGLPVENPFTKEEWEEFDKIVKQRRQKWSRRIKDFFFRKQSFVAYMYDNFAAYGEVYNRRKV